jgi:hypothetical protein
MTDIAIPVDSYILSADPRSGVEGLSKLYPAPLSRAGHRLPASSATIPLRHGSVQACATRW